MFWNRQKNKKIDKEKVSNTILNWGTGHERFLNVISLPYNSPDIFLDLIVHYMKNNRKILYITNENETNINIVEKIKSKTSYRNYSYIRNPNTQVNTMLTICDAKNASLLEGCFDLIIYDDISSISPFKAKEIIALIQNKAYENTRCIVYSFESIFAEYRELWYPVGEFNAPMIEPRTVLTRVDISKDIPFVVYDYLKWSIEGERKIIIYVPDDSKIEFVYSYLKNYCNELTNNIYKHFQREEDYRVFTNFEKIKNGIIITDDFREKNIKYKNTDVMVFFADDERFNYKNLLYLSKRVGRGEHALKGEVIFLANDENYHMDKAKDIARKFNKEAWELGLLKI